MANQSRAGVIDIGSHSIKLVVGERAARKVRVLEFLKNVFPVAEDAFFKEKISRRTINLAISILHGYRRVLDEYGIESPRVIATTAVREARNRPIFLDTVRRETGFSVEVFTPGDVVYHIDSYIGFRLRNRYPIGERNLLIAELGSGSLDLSVLRKGYLLMSVGLPLGTLRLKQMAARMRASPRDAFEGVREYAANEFRYLRGSLPDIQIDDVILISENFSYCVPAMLRGGRRTRGFFFPLSAAEAGRLLDMCAGKPVDEIAAAYDLPRDIAETMGVFAAVVNGFYGLARRKQVYILEATLPEAVLAHSLFRSDFSRAYPKTNHLMSMARALCEKYGADIPHARETARLSRVIFQGLRDRLGLKTTDLALLELGAWLHDIGQFISNRAHHKHSQYIVNALEFFRMDEEDVRVVGAVTRYHRQATPSIGDPSYRSLSTERQILVQKLSAVVRIANALDRSHLQKISKLTVGPGADQSIVFEVEADEQFALEKAAFDEKKRLLEEITGNPISLKVRHPWSDLRGEAAAEAGSGEPAADRG